VRYNGGLGTSVAINGGTAVAGAPWDDVQCSLDHGSAYVYVKPPSGWADTLSENAKLAAPGTCVYLPLGMRQSP
jgi:hypothetical protein